MKKSTRMCAMCDTIIPNTHVVCKIHFSEYVKSKSEPWMIELINTSRRQFEIDNEEIAIELGDFRREKRSYEKVTESNVKDVLNYKKIGLNPKAISKLTGLNYRKVVYIYYDLLKDGSNYNR